MTLVVDQLVAGYVSDVPVLDGISLTVATGSVVTIVGPNGSGKSTLLKAIMGYVTPRAGDVALDGASLRRVPVHQRAIRHGIAFVPQLDNVFGPLTVRENLELGGARMPRRQRRARIAELLELYPQLDERQRRRADAQSGGERQMLAVARALMTHPQFLLLDEPSAGLSPLMTERLFEMLAELRAREGVTILLVEQNAMQSLAISDRGLVLAAGRVALEDDAHALRDDPRVSALYLGGAGAVAEGGGPAGAAPERPAAPASADSATEKGAAP